MEAYRSGCNELHSKCSCPQGHVGSNPTLSAFQTTNDYWWFVFCLGENWRSTQEAEGAPLERE